MTRIKISGFDQFLHENQTWDRALNFYLQENAYLKTRLSQVVDNNTDKEFVDLAEHFHNNFIRFDESIKDILKDVINFQQVLKNAIKEKTTDEHLLTKQHQKLRNEMANFEMEFAGAKNKFNQYLNSML